MMLTVLNPVGFPPLVTQEDARAAPGTLERQDGLPRGLPLRRLRLFLAQMQAWFAEHMPGVQTVLKRISSVYLQGRPHHVGGDQVEGARRDPRRRPLKHLRAGGRRARDDDRDELRGSHRRRAHDKFDRVVRSVAEVNGHAGLRQVFVPQPIMGKTPAELRAYVDGRDPITGRPVMQEVIDGLTRPFADDELGPTEFDRSTPRLVEPDTEDALHRLFLDNGWTDMLPIVLPTEARRRGDAGPHPPQARRDRRAHAVHPLPRALGVLRREGRGERGHGGRAARVLSGHPRAGRHRGHRAQQ
jgi:hypothetical protein